MDIINVCQSQWPCGLRRRSTAARLLKLWVRIPLFFCNSWTLFPLTIYIHLYIGAIPFSHVLEWLCPHEGRVYGEGFFFLNHSPPRNPRGLFKAYPLGSSCISISSIDSQLAGRHSFAHLGEGSDLACPLWGVIHEHTQVVAHSLVPPCRLLWFPLHTS